MIVKIEKCFFFRPAINFILHTAAFSFCWLVPAVFFIILGEGVSNWVPLLLHLSRKRGGLQLN